MKKIISKKRELELDFWETWYAHNDPINITYTIWETRLERFPELGKLNVGQKGLDLGCGPMSIFEFSDIADTVMAIDPLDKEFRKFAPRFNRVAYYYGDGENLIFGSETFDWVACFNVIDHTPNPLRMLAEIYRLLKRDGTLFFEVFFEDTHTSPHYQLWREDKIEWVRGIFEEIRNQKEREEKLKRTVFSGVYKK